MNFGKKVLTLSEEINHSEEYHKRYSNDPNYVWVNCCQMYVLKSRLDEGECPYHQVVKHDSEGIPYLRYDEFDQDGNAY